MLTQTTAVEGGSALPPLDLRAQLNEALVLFYRGELLAGENLATITYSDSISAGDTEMACRAQRCRAQIAIEQGSLAQAELLLEEALALAAANGDRALIAGCHYAQARKEALCGQYEAVENSIGQALMNARAASNLLYEGHAYSLFGHCRSCQGLLEESREYWAAAVDIYTKLNSSAHLLLCLVSQAAVHFQLGEQMAVEANLDQAGTLTSCPNYGQDLAGGCFQLAYLNSLLGETALAQQYLDRGCALASQELDHQGEVARQMARGSFLHACGRYVKAAAYWASALEYAQQRHNRFAVAEVRLAHARTRLALGELPRANTLLQDAQTAFELLGASVMLARVDCAWGLYHLHMGARPAAEACYAHAVIRSTTLQHPGIVLRHEMDELQRQLFHGG